MVTVKQIAKDIVDATDKRLLSKADFCKYAGCGRRKADEFLADVPKVSGGYFYLDIAERLLKDE
ncbi:MAG: hypothetical protein ACOX7J_06465 [Bacillota bacterium]